MRTSTLSASGILICIALAGCGRSNTVYPDTNPHTHTSDTNGDQISIGDSVLPTGFYDQSVNQASVTLKLDARTTRSQSFALTTEAKTNAAGSFNGAGTGNLATLGLSQLESTRLADLSQVVVFQKTVSGSEVIRFALNVDLKCDGSDLRLLKSKGETITDTDVSTGFTAVSTSLASKTWQVSGDAVLDSSNAQVLDSDATSNFADLQALVAAYPSACLKSAKTTASDSAKSTATAGISIALGGSAAVTENSVLISKIKLGTQVLEAGDRSQ